MKCWYCGESLGKDEGVEPAVPPFAGCKLHEPCAERWEADKEEAFRRAFGDMTDVPLVARFLGLL